MSKSNRKHRQSKRGRAAMSPTCGGCLKGVDYDAVMEAVDKGTEYKHECGKVLVKAKEEAGR